MGGKASHKTRMKSKWKSRGVIGDLDKIFDIWKNTNFCQKCNIELCEGLYNSNRKCMDHNHETGEFRNILCNTCNFIINPNPKSNNKLNERFITFREDRNTYQVRIQQRNLKINKQFKTLDEALKFRNEIIKLI